jgi:hypothetical protein
MVHARSSMAVRSAEAATLAACKASARRDQYEWIRMHPKRAGRVSQLLARGLTRRGKGSESESGRGVSSDRPAARSLPRSHSGASARARMPATATHGCLRRSGTDVAHERAPSARVPCDGEVRRGGRTRIACTVVLEASSRARNDLRQCSSASTAISLKDVEKCCGSLSGESRRTTKRSGGQLTAARVCVCVCASVCVRVRCVLCVRACAHLRGCTRMWARHRSGD